MAPAATATVVSGIDQDADGVGAGGSLVRVVQRQRGRASQAGGVAVVVVAVGGGGIVVVVM